MTRKYRGIRSEIGIVMSVMSLLVIAGLGFSLVAIHKNSLTKEFEARGKASAESIAANISDFMMMGHELEAAKVLKEAMTGRGVKYAMVTGKEGKIKAHNDMRMAGKNYTAPGKPVKGLPDGSSVFKSTACTART